MHDYFPLLAFAIIRAVKKSSRHARAESAFVQTGAGIQFGKPVFLWIPAFAGMTVPEGINSTKINCLCHYFAPFHILIENE